MRSDRPGLLLFAIALAAYLLIDLFFSSPAGMTLTNGDEPHYLLAAHSLIHDGDLDLRNNYAEDSHTSFFDRPELPPTHLAEFQERVVRVHPMLGMPLFLALPYALAGRSGVLVALSVVFALGLPLLLRTLTAYIAAASAFWIVLFGALTYPLVVYSHQIYPETLAFPIVCFVLAATIVPFHSQRRLAALAVGAGLGVLPHLHFKFAVLSAGLYLFFLLRDRANLGLNLRWSLAPILVLAGAFVWWIDAVFGQFSLAVFVASSEGAFAGARIFDGMVGLLFDQEFGLVFFAPVYLMAVVGAVAMLRRPAWRLDVAFLVLIYLSQHLLSGSYYSWYAGLSPVPRFLIAVLPCLAVLAACGVETYWRQRIWLHLAVLGALTIWITWLILFVHRPYMFGFSVGSNSILREHYQAQNLIQRLPSFYTASDSTPYVQLGLFLVVLFAYWIWGIPFSRVTYRLWSANRSRAR